MTIYIGLSGTIAAGKGEVLRIIKEKYNSISYSLSDELRGILKEVKKEITRNNLMNIGNKLRKENGSDYIAMRLIKKVKKIKGQHKIIIFDSIRNPAEITAFKNEFYNNFSLIFTDANRRIRYERIKERKREGEESLSFNNFVNQDENDCGRNQPEYGTKLEECKKLADFIIINDKSLSDLEKKVTEVLNLCLKKPKEQ